MIDQMSEGDPDVVRPPQSRAERQAGLNDLSGSPTSPSDGSMIGSVIEAA